MRSGERTRAGRSPACSEPSVGSKRTRTTSPRLRLSVENTLGLPVERFPLLRRFSIDFPHFAAAFDDILPQSFAFALSYPAFDQFRHLRTALAGSNLLLEPVQGVRRNRIR